MAEPTDIGAILREARRRAGITLAELGRLCNYSEATMSRMERGKQPLRDVLLLRRVAEVLSIPPEELGLAADRRHASATSSDVEPNNGPRVGTNPMREGSGLVRRRDLLGAAVAAGAAAALPGDNAAAAAPSLSTGNPADVLVTKVSQRLLHGTLSVEPGDVARALTQVRGDFQAARYVALAARLPQLLDAAETHAANSHDAAAHALLSETYVAATQVLLKLGELGLAWMTVDRALLAARRADDPLAVAEASREAAILARKAEHFDVAVARAAASADALDTTDPGRLSVKGLLLCSAGYAASQAGDREGSAELLQAAAALATRVDPQANHRHTAFNATTVAVYQVGAAWALGDGGTAVRHASTIDFGGIRLPERRARGLVDVARAYEMVRRPDAAFRALQLAEQAAPEEVRNRPLVRSLTMRLLGHSGRVGMAGIRDFAQRVGAI